MSDPDSIQDPFALIERGNDLESSQSNKDLWAASYHFLRASTVLRDQSEEMLSRNPNASKTRKVAALYQDQSVEYLHRARNALINALTMERDSDLKVSSEKPSRVEAVSLLLGESNEETKLDMRTDDIFEPFMESLEEAQVIQRRNLFQKLFISWDESKLNDLIDVQKSEDDEKEMKLFSLEERLAMLETSLPTNLAKPKSEAERMDALQKSLSGLGVSVPYRSDNLDQMYRDHDVSEEDQVDEIMNMAKDEAALDGGNQDTTDVMELLKKSSIRINLDPDGDPEYDMDDDDSPTSSTSGGIRDDAEMQFWKNLEIDGDAEEPTSKLEAMKRHLSNAQQLLLQAAMCLEELEERGYTFDNDDADADVKEVPMGVIDDDTNVKVERSHAGGDATNGDSKVVDDKGNGTTVEKPTSKEEVEVADADEKETNDDEVESSARNQDHDALFFENIIARAQNEINIEERDKSPTADQIPPPNHDKGEKTHDGKSSIHKSEPTVMGKAGLEEAREALDKLLAMWTPKVGRSLEDE